METKHDNPQIIQRLKDAQYPTIMALFTLVIGVLFFGAARFLSTSINAAISSPDEAEIRAQLTHIDETNYARIEKKLHLPAIQPTISTNAQQMPAAETPSAVEQIVERQGLTEQKTAFSLGIFNSTKKPGIAGTVKNDFAAAGFSVAKTGNTAPQEPQTILKIKERVQANSAIIEEMLAILKTRFTVGDPQLLEDASPYDIVIIIGERY